MDSETQSHNHVFQLSSAFITFVKPNVVFLGVQKFQHLEVYYSTMKSFRQLFFRTYANFKKAKLLKLREQLLL